MEVCVSLTHPITICNRAAIVYPARILFGQTSIGYVSACQEY